MTQFATQFENLATAYKKRYPRICEALEKDSILAKHGTVNESNIAQLGSMIDKTRAYLKAKNEQGTVTDLGLAAKFAIDLVTVGYTGAPPALMANIQQINSQNGYVWYEATKAESTYGNVNAGDTLDNPLKRPDVYAKNYGVPADEQIGTTTAAPVLNLAGALKHVPVRPRSVTISVDAENADFPIVGTDAFGNGTGFGNGITFTVNYATGDIAITFTGTNPGAGKSVFAKYDFEAEYKSAIPTINIDLETKPVKAQVCALQAQVGLLKQYEMQSVLGIDAATRTAQKLAEELNREISTKLVDLLEAGANAGGSAEVWVKNPAYQVGLEVQHQQSLDYALIDLDSDIYDKADRGAATFYVGSRKVGTAELTKIVPKADRSAQPAQQGTSLAGVYGDKPIIRAASLEDNAAGNANILGNILGGYRGQYPWDAALVIGVHMPIVAIKDIPDADNILLTKQGIATWAAFERISDAFCGKVTILDKTPNNVDGISYDVIDDHQNP